jgi:hypothetical protein
VTSILDYTQVFGDHTGNTTLSFFAYPGFIGGARVATANVKRDIDLEARHSRPIRE